MKLFLLLLICILCGSSVELRPNPNWSKGTLERFTSHKVITFIGTVKSIEPLGQRELRVIPVDRDSRFAITIQIEAVPRESPLESGKDQVFAVHSPARLFRLSERDIIGRKYRFKVTCTEGRFSDLTAVPNRR